MKYFYKVYSEIGNREIASKLVVDVIKELLFRS